MTDVKTQTDTERIAAIRKRHHDEDYGDARLDQAHLDRGFLLERLAAVERELASTEIRRSNAATAYIQKANELDHAEAALAAMTHEREERETPLCERCGGPHSFDTTVPSVRWNSVIRKHGLPDYLCLPCIIKAFALFGGSFTAELIGVVFDGGVPIEVRIGNDIARDAIAISEENTTLRARLYELTRERQAMRTLLKQLVILWEKPRRTTANPVTPYPKTYQDGAEETKLYCARALAALLAERQPPQEETNEQPIRRNQKSDSDPLRRSSGVFSATVDDNRDCSATVCRSGMDVAGAALASDVDVHAGSGRAPDGDHSRADPEVARAARPPEPPVPELLHPVNQVWFRAGLIACREYMARFVEAQSPTIAMSIRANWWPQLGKDFGPPRKLDFQELTVGEHGTPEFRCKTAEEVSPTQEALPIALGFLQQPTPPAPPEAKTND